VSILVVLFSSWLQFECFQELVPELDPLKSNEMPHILLLPSMADVMAK